MEWEWKHFLFLFFKLEAEKNERVNEALGKHVREAWAHKAGADDKAVNELRVVYSEEDVAEKMEQKKEKLRQRKQLIYRLPWCLSRYHARNGRFLQ